MEKIRFFYGCSRKLIGVASLKSESKALREPLKDSIEALIK